MISADAKFLIVGLGLLGGSYAMGLKQRNYQVNAIDINADAINFALDNGIIDHGATFNDPELLKDADYLIIGLYPQALVPWLKDNLQYLKPDVIISDVCGIKNKVIRQIESILPNGMEYISHHPMAGKEVSGVFYSDPKIFLNANFIITPTENNTPRGLSYINDLANILRFNKIVTLTLEEHDEMIAFLSQLPHVIAVCLMNCKDNTHLSAYTGDSFRDLTRIAKINENLWSELFLMNKDMLLDQIDLFTSQLSIFRAVLANEDSDEMKRLFISSTKRRQAFDK